MTNNITSTVQIVEASCCRCETPIINDVREGDVVISFLLNMPDGTNVRYGTYSTKITDGRGIIELNEPLKAGEVQIQVDEETCQALAYKNIDRNFEVASENCTLKVLNFETEIIGGVGKITSFETDLDDVLFRLDSGEWGGWEDFEIELGVAHNIGIKSKLSMDCRINFPVIVVEKEIKVPYGVPSLTPAVYPVPTAVPTITFTPVSLLVPVNTPTPVSVPVGVATPTPVAFIQLVPLPTPVTLLTPIPVGTPVSTPVSIPTPVCCLRPSGLTQYYFIDRYEWIGVGYLTGMTSVSEAIDVRDEIVAATGNVVNYANINSTFVTTVDPVLSDFVYGVSPRTECDNYLPSNYYVIGVSSPTTVLATSPIYHILDSVIIGVY